MIRWLWRLLRKPDRPTSLTPLCRHCRQKTHLCAACAGGWRDVGCADCGVGWRCAQHGIHWFG